MTNEELVLEYQQGNQDAIEELWLQVRGFITTKAIEYLKQFPAEHQSLKDDLIQQSYFSQREIRGFIVVSSTFGIYILYTPFSFALFITDSKS